MRLNVSSGYEGKLLLLQAPLLQSPESRDQKACGSHDIPASLSQEAAPSRQLSFSSRCASRQVWEAQGLSHVSLSANNGPPLAS